MTDIPIDRNHFGVWLDEHALNGSGAEIGCAWGEFASQMLSTWKHGKTYYMVDSWRRLPKDEYLENQDSNDYNSWYERCKKIAEEDNRVVLIRMKSVDASKCFKDESLDWVYIDAAHDFKNVTDDLNAWYHKVKLEGLIAGHDFMNQVLGNIDVENAVTAFSKEHGLTFKVTPCTSWWIVKK